MRWPVSSKIIARVRRPSVTSINFFSTRASSFNLRMGEEPGLTTARIRPTLTALPKPILTSLLSMNCSAHGGDGGRWLRPMLPRWKKLKKRSPRHETVPARDLADSYSIFCTCSRSFSISFFISTPRWAMPALEIFEARVLTSRKNSCRRKSSRRPTGSSLCRKALNC